MTSHRKTSTPEKPLMTLRVLKGSSDCASPARQLNVIVTNRTADHASGVIQTRNWDPTWTPPENETSECPDWFTTSEIIVVSERPQFVVLSIADVLREDFGGNLVYFGKQKLEDGSASCIYPFWFWVFGYSTFPYAYNATGFCVKIETYEPNERAGIQIKFSLHRASASFTEELSPRPWDCTTPEWPEFQQHLRCNFIPECSGGEDEKDCPYTPCGDGGFRLKESCYMLRRKLRLSKYYTDTILTTAISVEDAIQGCAQLGATLVNLNSKEETTAVLSLVPHFSGVFIGLVRNFVKLPHLYWQIATWSDHTAALGASSKQMSTNEIDLIRIKGLSSRLCHYHILGTNHPFDCFLYYEHSYYLCEDSAASDPQHRTLNSDTVYKTSAPTPSSETLGVVLSLRRENTPNKHMDIHGKVAVPIVLCLRGHYSLSFLAIDSSNHCLDERAYQRSPQPENAGSSSQRSSAEMKADAASSDSDSNKDALPHHSASSLLLSSMFLCSSGTQKVSYTLVCDYRSDCTDSSDEAFCVFGTCTGDSPFTCTEGKQCYSYDETCDGVEQCISSGDELDCLSQCAGVDQSCSDYLDPDILPPPAIIYFDRLGFQTFVALNTSKNEHSSGKNISYFPATEHKTQEAALSQCPETHFQCPNGGYCLPVYFRCNGFADCPGREDETGCEFPEDVACPGFYRCHSSAVCLHLSDVCDGSFQCPQHDDELFCDMTCPQSCVCQGLAFACGQPFPAELYPAMRYLDASGSGMDLAQLANNSLLISVSLAHCALTNVSVVELPNLLSLDLSHNFLTALHFDAFLQFTNLLYLSLKNNQFLTIVSGKTETNITYNTILSLDLSGVPLTTLDLGIFSPFKNLQTLNLSGSGTVVAKLESVHHPLVGLQVVDLSGCPFEQFPPTMFKVMRQLQFVIGDTYKLCCTAVLPDTMNPNNCHNPEDDVSSCDNLLQSTLNRVVLIVLAVLTLTLNAGTFAVRVRTLFSEKESGFGVFVINLCLSDWVMGVYLAIICIADSVYRDSYLWQERNWRQSVGCQVAGFLALVSCEVSSFNICLITLDRFLVVRFPFSRRHFRRLTAQLTCGAVWVVGTLISAVPFLPGLRSTWTFYSHAGICIPLPISRRVYPGQSYSFGVMIVLNMVLFLCVAVGQSAIYAAIRSNAMDMEDDSRKQRNVSIARRLIAIAVTDFLCWFPVGVLGILANLGYEIPKGANIALLTFVIPLNSAFNPLVYTLNNILEKRRCVREKKMLAWLKTNQQNLLKKD